MIVIISIRIHRFRCQHTINFSISSCNAASFWEAVPVLATLSLDSWRSTSFTERTCSSSAFLRLPLSLSRDLSCSWSTARNCGCQLEWGQMGEERRNLPQLSASFRLLLVFSTPRRHSPMFRLSPFASLPTSSTKPAPFPSHPGDVF